MHATWVSAWYPQPMNTERPGARPREVASGDAARRARPELSERVGLDHGDEPRRRRVEEADDEARSRRRRRVQLPSGEPEPTIGRGHVGERAVVELEAPPRSVLDHASPHTPEAVLDRPDGVGRREKRGDVGFGQVQRHRGKSMDA